MDEASTKGRRASRGGRLGSTPVATIGALWAFLAALVLAAGCGSDDGCSGFVSINASPERCAQLAEELGCGSFEVTGPSCGLVACARCEGD